MSWPRFWQSKKWQTWLLMPLSAGVCYVAKKRLQAFEQHPPLPVKSGRIRPVVVVIGNIVVGGSGKTPFIQWLARLLMAQNVSVGIVSRGYGGKSTGWPQNVTADSDPALVGDEPVLLAQSLGCPVVVAPKRCEALQRLMVENACEVVLSDDGLQHYALPRDLEIVLMDVQRGVGNGLCLPAGPLREPASRLQKVDFVVWNGGTSADTLNMRLEPVCFRQVLNPAITCSVQAFSGQAVYAMAGIGNPQRYYEQLQMLGIEVMPLAFKDHHAYQVSDFNMLKSEKPLLMTQKDAVKCTDYAQDNWWYLEIAPQCSPALAEQLMRKISLAKHVS